LAATAVPYTFPDLRARDRSQSGSLPYVTDFVTHRGFVPRRWVHIRDLLQELVARDMKLRYRGSFLGMAWTLLNPLAELLVLVFVFSKVLRVDIPNYAAYLFTGLLVYGWFQTALNFATGAILHNRELVRRPGVPPTILPIVTVASTLVHFLMSLPILVALLMLSHVRLTVAVMALPLLVAVEFILILGFAYPVAAMNVMFRDTQHLLRVALQLLFFVTPIFYDARQIPERFQFVYQINPMAHLVSAYRAVLLQGTFPDSGVLAMLAAASAALLTLGVTWFRQTSHRFVDEV
jgi:lipopolysaccharide transport system permease protein